MGGFRLLPSGVAFVAFLASMTAVSAQSIDPVMVLQRYYEARNRGDVAGAMSVVAPDATYTTGPCAPVCMGASAIQQHEVEKGIAGGGQYTAVDATASAMTVTLRLEIETTSRSKRASIDYSTTLPR